MSTDTKKVLVVDDEKDLRDAVKTALVYEGFEVEVAEDGIDGYAKAREMHPDLILLDILMPKQNGIDMLKSIRKEEWGKHVQVIVMTVLDDMGKISEALESGANEYLVKTDVSLGNIVEKIKAKLS